jgi:hypothetical protein
MGGVDLPDGNAPLGRLMQDYIDRLGDEVRLALRRPSSSGTRQAPAELERMAA